MLGVRLAFVNLFKARHKAGDEDAKLVFDTTLLIPPTLDKSIFVNAMKAAMLKKFNKLVQLEGRNNPIHPCHDDYSGYAEGWFYLGVANERQPPVVNAARIPITDRSLVYGGQWANVVLTCYAWDHKKGGKGVSFQLDAVQVLRDGSDKDPGGARLDGRGKPVNPDDVFEALEMPPTEGGATDDNFDPLAGFDFK